MKQKVRLSFLLVIILTIALMSTMVFASSMRLKQNYPGNGGPVDWIERVSLHKSQGVGWGVSADFNLWVTVYVDHHFEDNKENSHIVGVSQSVGLTGSGLNLALTNAGSSHYIYSGSHIADISGYGIVSASVNVAGEIYVNYRRIKLAISYSVF